MYGKSHINDLSSYLKNLENEEQCKQSKNKEGDKEQKPTKLKN